jgi:N6-adenosine-specific RNA methylase IME4
MIWVKPGLGMGHWARQNHELLLIGKRGEMSAPAEGDRPASVVEAPKGEHSEKPGVFYDIIERMVRTHSRVELFARKAREGWASWGLEAGAK